MGTEGALPVKMGCDCHPRGRAPCSEHVGSNAGEIFLLNRNNYCYSYHMNLKVVVSCTLITLNVVAAQAIDIGVPNKASQVKTKQAITAVTNPPPTIAVT